MKKLLAVVALFIAGATFANTQTAKEFYVYTEQGSPLNHFIPSGWMGDYGDLKLSQGIKDKPGKGVTAIQVKYSGERKQGSGWAGIYWQSPANNWGDKRGGFNLTGYKKVVFMARGEKGGEYIDGFKIGGIVGQTEEGDSDQADSGSIELTKQWKEYSIDIGKLDLSHIVGGFCVVLSGDVNPEGATFYIDEVRYVR